MGQHHESYLILVIASLFFLISNLSLGTIVFADDWKGKPKWGGTSHEDNNPSEKKFWKIAEDKKLHSLAKAIDHMVAKENDIDMDKFRETTAWKNATEDEKFCIIESEDLGNSLADYEVMKCYMNPAYYENR